MNKTRIVMSAEGSDFSPDQEVFIAESATPNERTRRELPEDCMPGIQIDAPGYMDDEIVLSFVNFHIDNRGDGWDVVAAVSLDGAELDELIAHLCHVRDVRRAEMRHG